MGAEFLQVPISSSDLGVGGGRKRRVGRTVCPLIVSEVLRGDSDESGGNVRIVQRFSEAESILKQQEHRACAQCKGHYVQKRKRA